MAKFTEGRTGKITSCRTRSFQRHLTGAHSMPVLDGRLWTFSRRRQDYSSFMRYVPRCGSCTQSEDLGRFPVGQRGCSPEDANWAQIQPLKVSFSLRNSS